MLVFKLLELPAWLFRPNVFKDRLGFKYDNNLLAIYLPSGRQLSYWGAHRKRGKYNRDVITYLGLNQTSRKWSRIDTYGGKLTENIVQAVARDLLAFCMTELNSKGWDIVMHVHDETACEIDDNYPEYKEETLEELNATMSIPPKWASGFPLNAEGFILTIT